jgi:protocatechuate 3,4-dioxygenase beta subunit
MAGGFKRISAGVWLWLLLCTPQSAGQTTSQAQGQTNVAQVSGRVLRADTGGALPKATVTLRRIDGRRENYVARTDSNGAFRFLEVDPGAYRLEAVRNGYVRQVYGQRGGGPGIALRVDAGQKLDGLELRLGRAGVISGTITDEDNEPVEGVLVRAQRVRFSPGGRQQVTTARSTTTDDLGNYRLPGLAPGFYYVMAAGREGVSVGSETPYGYAPTYYPGVAERESAHRVQVTAGEEARGVDIAVQSRPTLTISGVIVDNAPRIRGYGIGFTSGGSTALRTARADGSFELRGIEPGEYTLTAITYLEDGRQRRAHQRIHVGNADLRVVMEIGQPAEVRGEVRIEDTTRISLRGLRVFLQPEIESSPLGGASVEEGGRFVIRDVAEGRYSFEIAGAPEEAYLESARCGGEDFTGQPMELSKGQVREDCVLTLRSDAVHVTGVVLREAEPVAGAVVVLIPVERERRKKPRHTGTAQTDANGGFVMRGVIPGEYFAFAVEPTDDASYYDLDFPERNRDRAERVTIKPGGSFTLSLKMPTSD